MIAEYFGGPKDGWILEFPGNPPPVYQFPHLAAITPKHWSEMPDPETVKIEVDVYHWSRKMRKYVYQKPERK